MSIYRWDEGLTPDIECAKYWARLESDTCSKTRCHNHGLCVGFEFTGGCLCSPSYTGRFCTANTPINTNKAEVNVVSCTTNHA